MSPCWWAQGLWSPLQQTQLCNQSDSIMQINSSIFYSPFRSHHSALSWSLASNQITGIMFRLWKSLKKRRGSITRIIESRVFFPDFYTGWTQGNHFFSGAKNTVETIKGLWYILLHHNTKFKYYGMQKKWPLTNDQYVLERWVEMLQLVQGKSDSRETWELNFGSRKIIPACVSCKPGSKI